MNSQGQSKSRVTSYCVAKEAGVSQSAVSRAFNPGASISQETRQKVTAAAQKLGYKPNAIARSLISKRSNMIGIVMADVVNPFYPAVLDIFVRKLQDRGHKGMLFMVQRDEEVDEVLTQLMDYQVDGVVITSATLSSEMAGRCAAMGSPVVLFNRDTSAPNTNSICCDNEKAGRDVADYLVSRGAKSLAFMAGVENTSTSRDREFGFIARAREMGMPHPLRVVGNYTYHGGYEAAEQLVTQWERPDALFCANDLMALGAMDALRYKLGLSVPNDVAVVGFDDIDNASWPVYDLTTVRVPVEAMVEQSIDSLLKRVNNQEEAPIKQCHLGELIIRSSAG